MIWAGDRAPPRRTAMPNPRPSRSSPAPADPWSFNILDVLCQKIANKINCVNDKRVLQSVWDEQPVSPIRQTQRRFARGRALPGMGEFFDAEGWRRPSELHILRARLASAGVVLAPRRL